MDLAYASGAGDGLQAGCKSLYVGNLHPYVNEAMLQEIFSTLGPVLEVKVIKDKVTGMSAGYGFVKFLDHRVADLALQTINGRVLYGQARAWPPKLCARAMTAAGRAASRAGSRLLRRAAPHAPATAKPPRSGSFWGKSGVELRCP